MAFFNQDFRSSQPSPPQPRACFDTAQYRRSSCEAEGRPSENSLYQLMRRRTQRQPDPDLRDGDG
jgi:hypothetical protein